MNVSEIPLLVNAVWTKGVGLLAELLSNQRLRLQHRASLTNPCSRVPQSAFYTLTNHLGKYDRNRIHTGLDKEINSSTSPSVDDARLPSCLLEFKA